MSDVIGRGTWLDKVAYKVVEREKMLGRSLELIRVESGLGASGIPHVGTLSDAVRAYGIKKALENLGYRAELIAYADDMDGLRKVPQGLPDWLNEHIAEPVSLVPDPFGCHSSFGSHMISLLLDGLERLKIEYRFQSGREAYKKGLLNDQIKKILENSKLVGAKIKELLGQEKFEEVLPYYPLCERCGRIYLAEAYAYLAKEEKVLYRCVGAKLGGKHIEGCGYEGEAKATDGEGKLSWKGEFAARWSALDIRFEAYGKDIADSVKVNDWISDEILHHPHPYHVRYELFLDKSGRKISKSLGNVFTPQVWLRYGSPQSLLLLMYKRILGTRNLSPTDVPTYMDEYDRIEDVYFGRMKVENPATLRKLKGLYEYLHHLNPPQKPSIHVPYMMLVHLTSIAPKDDLVGFVMKKLRSYGIAQEPSPELEERIRLAANWSEDFVALERPTITISEQEKGAIAELVDVLRTESDGKMIQNEIFSIARRHGLEVADFFKTLYKIILGVEKGPRLGPYLVDMGREKAAQILLNYIR